MRALRKFFPLLIVIVLIGLVVGPFLWDAYSVTALCKDVQPGTPVETLRALAEKHGVKTAWVKPPGIYSEGEKAWLFFVPVTATFGDVSCMIRHDKSVVLSAQMIGDEYRSPHQPASSAEGASR
jgi:hypothetical protein